MLSLAESLASLPEAKRNELTKSLTDAEAFELLYRWDFWARPNQLAPSGDWVTWIVLAGRGFGKTRCGCEWVRSQVCGGTPLEKGQASRIALVAETAADARDVIVEGESGLLSIHPPDFRPHYEPSKRRLTWPNGAIATLYNAVEPDQLRGPQHDLALCDELAKWKYGKATWDNLQFGLRLGDNPRQAITTTPRPIPLIKEILADRNTVITRGSTYENRANLPPKFFDQIVAKYEGTRIGRQELRGEILDDVPGALWTRENLDKNREDSEKLPKMQRIVVGIDPQAKTSTTDIAQIEESAETGIICAGLGYDGRGYVMADYSCRASPFGWASRAMECFDDNEADMFIAEINQGGAMVEYTLRSVRPAAPIKTVHASRGKVTRADPIAALYEQNRISHVGDLDILEDQMMLFTTHGMEAGTTGDRVDAMVWALTELFWNLIYGQVKVDPSKPKRDRWDKAFSKGEADRDWKVA